ncbi:hypothetical protein [Streptomyces olivochromogenes]|uniref:Uncharacterized protein n=1 Tax=Streptomyces olivochromogenes TaxID=1963 RepID=A0A250VTI7_STROL|nr:hypothetical protein [Streptomyces olivochromogenes]KUN38267.1 hypothetical protein AQJ27_45020 [Streptomyces olivochromogenes]GAX57290.1 hypothetical protein SO3561_08860 [Streptomyces olivochromogenes]
MRDVTCASTSSASTTPKTTVLESFPAGAPRGSWPAEEFAEALRLEGQPAEVVMDLAADSFLVIVKKVTV